MNALTGKKRLLCQPLFDEVPIWRAFIESAIESGYGEIVADSNTNPQVAVLNYGGLIIYVGKHDSPEVDDIIRYYAVQPVILGYSNEWNRKIENILGDRIKPAKRYHLPYTDFRYGHIEEILAESGGRYNEIGIVDYTELQSSLDWEHHLHHYKDRDDFLANGNGFIIEYRTNFIWSIFICRLGQALRMSGYYCRIRTKKRISTSSVSCLLG